jgi:polysaccharide biosynthesis/export protein
MRNWFCLMAVIAFTCFSASLRAQDPTPKNAQNDGEKVLTARNIDPRPPVESAKGDPNYSIGAEDVLTIDVWKEPEVSRTVPVRTDGKISLPLLHDVQAAGLTPTELGSEITERLRKTIVNPQVTVIVAQMNSQRIYILGQVAHGGAFPFLPDLTAVQALSGAGGFTPFANLKKIYVMRSENGHRETFPINYKEVISGRKPLQDIRLEPGDTIVVP